MMRREYVRRPSLAAGWALPPSVFAPVLAAVALLSHRFGLMTPATLVLVLFVAFLFAVAGALLALLGFRALWRNAAIGGRRSAMSMLFCAPVLMPAAYAAYLVQTTAPLSDISSDTDDPPHFSRTAPVVGENSNEPPRLNGAIQQKFYPQVTGRRYQLSPDFVTNAVQAVVADNGWTAAPSRVSGATDMLIEAAATTAVVGFTDDVLIRITDEGESTYVDMRSASRYGKRDLGANAARIVRFMEDLDLKIQAAATLPNSAQ